MAQLHETQLHEQDDFYFRKKYMGVHKAKWLEGRLKWNTDVLCEYRDIVHWFLVAFSIVSYLSELVVGDLSLFQIPLLPV